MVMCDTLTFGAQPVRTIDVEVLPTKIICHRVEFSLYIDQGLLVRLLPQI